MGCDVHLHIELLVDNEWEHYAALEPDRMYTMFEKMAGVRGSEFYAISKPKGLPEKLSVITQISADKWGSDGHSHSWLDAKEIAELSRWYEEDRPGSNKYRSFEMYLGNTYLFGNGFASAHNYSDQIPDQIEDLRFVFWFDN